ncbi:phosphoprotein phosphatase 1, partial [Trichinella spiralis]|uniref:phosphoprotein phosphatase 1 n=1 Tax=Trichinella spiralis TaxID=6334 RepID=UPI0001EFBEC4
VNSVYGFLEEVRHRYSRDLYIKFNHLFNFLPVAGLISGKIFCMHGGLSKDLETFDQIRSIERPVEIPLQGLLADLLWSDPDRNINGWEISSRNVGYVFGEDVILEFCEKMRIDLIVRAHQVVDPGYEFFADAHLVTIFSAPNYCRQFSNLAGVLQALRTTEQRFTVLTVCKHAQGIRYAIVNTLTGSNPAVEIATYSITNGF